jgi:DNA-binding response OmpR family regulator
VTQQSPARAPTGNRSPPAPKAIVLIVDDDPDIGESIGDVLRAGGYTVEIVGDGQGAIEVARRSRVGLVLLDWRLPTDPHGGALVRRLRDVCGPSLPVVVLSADPMALAEAREAQVADYLPKPFEVADLLHIVDTYYPA